MTGRTTTRNRERRTRNRSRLFVVAALCIFSAAAEAQGNATKAPPRTTATGVYGRDQANRGQDVYLGMCKNCHSPDSHTGATFQTKWMGKPLSELYAYIRDLMPKNAPGTLTPEENADVLAYLLKLNRMPDGDDDLPPDEAAMKSIRIESPRPARRTP